MKIQKTLNQASLPRAIEQAVKSGYSEEDAERILTKFVERRFETGRDPGDEHQEPSPRTKDGERISKDEMLERYANDEHGFYGFNLDSFYGES